MSNNPPSKHLGLLAAYASSEEEEEEEEKEKHSFPESQVAKRQKIVAAPDVEVVDPASMQIMLSGSYAELAMVPVVGPANPFSTKDHKNNWLTGHIQEDAFNENDFRLQQRTFRTFGYAADPSANAVDENGIRRIIGDLEKAKANGGATVLDARGKHDLSSMPKRLPKGDVAIVEGEGAYLGPWAGYEGERIGEKSGPEGGVVATDAAAAAKDKEIHVGSEKSIFHGKSERDYLGRTYMHVPQDVDTNLLGEAGSQECFLPKRTIHTYKGHTKGVSAVRFIPNSAHLLLSAGMDTKIKIWDVYHDRKCLRTYLGHNKAVRDITFSNDGRKFLSASYDRYIKLWDTETGQCIKSFTTKKIPYCVKFNPDTDKQNIFLAGCSDKKIVQFDINTGEITQEYDQHLGAVNSITFVDDNRRFVTTSDDKTLRAWEFDIPVVIKYVAEPYMHSMPSVTLHPNMKWLACQSLDNQILIYGAKDRFRQHRKKRFAGHLVDSYACQIGFSPDGRYLSSGDAEGRLWFWDWKTCKILKKIKLHDQVLIGHEWHPHETSKVATCSWDGNIHLLD